MSCLKEGLYCSKLSCRVTIRGWVSQDFTSGRSKCLRGERLGKKWTLSNTLSKGCPQHGGGQFTEGLVTNSTLSCLLFCKHEARGHCKNFYKHTNKGFETGMRKLLEGTKLNNSSSMREGGSLICPPGKFLRFWNKRN